VDVSPLAIAEAERRCRIEEVAAEWLVANVLDEPLPDDFDVVTCSLFLHHLADDDIVQLLRIMRDATDCGGEVRHLLICDLSRSALNLALVAVGAQLVTRSPVVHRDATSSVRAAMSRPEFTALVETALGQTPRVESLFPCRFLAEISLA
jgi:2-polyprenyl-3-methyl-5-hydroxy-6-metoxy-1,4-benzoquinol methylase